MKNLRLLLELFLFPFLFVGAYLGRLLTPFAYIKKILFLSVFILSFTISTYAANSCPADEILIDANGRTTEDWTNWNNQSISGSNDTDYFKIVLTTETTLDIKVDNKTNGGKKTQLNILASDCSTNLASKNGRDYTLSKILDAGTYYAKVSYGDGNTDYKIQARFDEISDLQISKSVDNASATVGDTVKFTLTATNHSNTSSDIEIIDILPSGFSIDSVTENKNNFSCSTNGQKVTCSGGQNVSENEEVIVQITTIASTAGDYTNAANVASTNRRSDPNLNNNEDSVNVTIVAVALVDEITSFSAPSEVTEGETITVTVSYNVSEEREIVTGFQQNHSPWDGWGWTTTNVSAGTGTINISVTIPTGQPLGNTYQIPITLQPIGGDWNSRLDSESENPVNLIATVGTADLVLVKSVNHESVKIDEQVIFELNATNNGPDNSAVIIRDTVPDGFKIDSVTSNSERLGCEYPDNNVTCKGTDGLATDEVFTVQIYATAIKVGTYTNVAQISSYEELHDPDLSNNEDNATVTNICRGCDCSLDSSANDETPGMTIPDLNGTTTDVTKCISGISEQSDTDGKEDYYNFTVQTAGTLSIDTTSPNDHPYRMQVWKNGVRYYGIVIAEVHSISNQELVAGDEIIVYFKEDGDDLDEYQATFQFTKALNTPPSAVISVSPSSGPEGTEFSFDGTASTDDGGASNLTYAWTEGGTSLGSSAAFSKNDFTVGVHTITLTVTDTEGLSDAISTDIEVTVSPNEDPTAYDKNITITKNTTVTKNAMDLGGITDSDPDGDTLTASKTTNPSHGTITSFNSDGTFVYEPVNDYIGNDSFTYTIDDGNGGTDTATIFIEIIETPPVTEEGPDICYYSREETGIKLPFMKLFYKETTGVRTNKDIEDIHVLKAITRGIDFFNMMSGIGIDDDSKTVDVGDDQAEVRSFFSADFIDNDYNFLSIFPGGTVYRLGDGADTATGGDMSAGDETSYYNSTMFSFGFFTQYAHLVTYTKDGITYSEVLQPCDADTFGDLPTKPNIEGCGLFMGALNSATKVTFETRAGVWQLVREETQINTPVLADPNGVALCKGNVACAANGIGSSIIELPDFLISNETSNNEVGYSTVIGGQQEIGSIVITHEDDTELERTFVFEAPYSADYSGKVMLIKSITDSDSHADKHTYIFKAGDYWIDEWGISGNKNVTIKTSGNVRFFINKPFYIDINGALNIGQDSTEQSPPSDPKYYMFLYDDLHLNVTGASASYLGYIYSKGKITLASTTTFAVKYGGITADEELTINTGAPGDFLSHEDNTENDGIDNGIFQECVYGNCVQWSADHYDVSEDFENPMTHTKMVSTVITLSGGSLGYAVDVNYTTYDGTAIAGADYPIGQWGTVTIPAGESSVTLDIEIYNDPAIELDEHFFVQLSDPSPSLICLNEFNLTRINILAQENAPICFTDDFSGGLDNKWRVLKSVGGFIPEVVNVNGDARLRITDDTRNVATVVTKDYKFSTSQNLIIVEFDYYAYGGCNGGGMGGDGADGIVNVLFDSSVGDSPTPGSFGGSMGYAQRNGGKDGFEGGWLGLGIDEYGNFGNCNEGRQGGLSGCPFGAQGHRNTAVIRGDGEGTLGYEFLRGVELTLMTPPQPKVAQKTGYGADGFYSGRYKMTVDARDSAHLWIRLERSMDPNADPVVIIDQFDAKEAGYGQGATPDFIRYAISGGTGGGCNNHELSWIEMRGNCEAYIMDDYTIGPFAAVDDFRWEGNGAGAGLKDYDDKSISTKLANEEFTLVIASMNPEGTATEFKQGVDAKYGIYSGDDNQAHLFSDIKDFDPNTKHITSSYTITEAFDNAHMRIFYCGDYDVDTGITTVFPLVDCGIVDNTPASFSDAVEEQTAGKHLFFHHSNSFAIKPSDFTIEESGNHFKAGEAIGLTYQAINNLGNPTPSFSEYAGTTFLVTVEESTSGCKVGDFTPSISEDWKFTAGQYATGVDKDENGTVIDTVYDEVGKIKITISDENLTCEERFAGRDCKDKNITGYWNTEDDTFIGTDTTDEIEIIPDHFDINTTLADHHLAAGTTPPFTYLSSDLNMSAELNITITAQDSFDETVTNYNSDCYAKPLDIDIDIEYIPAGFTPNTPSSILYRLEADGTTFLTADSAILTSIADNSEMDGIDKGIFKTGDHNGSAELMIKLNLERENDQVVNPFEMNVSEITVRDDDNVVDKVSKDAPNTNANFYFARVKSSKYFYEDVTDASVITPISVVVYNDPTTSAFGLDVLTFRHTDEFDWYLSTAHDRSGGDGDVTLIDYSGSVKIAPASIDLTGGSRDVTVSYPTGSPHPLDANIDFVVDNMPIDTSGWLIYNEGNGSAAPSPFYRVRFVDTIGWAGHGDTGSVVDSNTSSRQNRRTGW